MAAFPPYLDSAIGNPKRVQRSLFSLQKLLRVSPSPMPLLLCAEGDSCTADGVADLIWSLSRHVSHVSMIVQALEQAGLDLVQAECLTMIPALLCTPSRRIDAEER